VALPAFRRVSPPAHRHAWEEDTSSRASPASLRFPGRRDRSTSLDSLLAPMLGSRCCRCHADNYSGTSNGPVRRRLRVRRHEEDCARPESGSSANAPTCLPLPSTGTGIAELANGQAGASPPIVWLLPVVGRPWLRRAPGDLRDLPRAHAPSPRTPKLNGGASPTTKRCPTRTVKRGPQFSASRLP
jgi:hypothetical protein